MGFIRNIWVFIVHNDLTWKLQVKSHTHRFAGLGLRPSGLQAKAKGLGFGIERFELRTLGEGFCV